MSELLSAMLRKLPLILLSGLLLAGCSRQAVPPQPRSDEARGASVSFVDKVWRVDRSSKVASGTLYVFLSEGTLLITSPNSRPALGSWTYERGALTMVEEGISYRVDILELRGDEFRIRINNPGTPVEIRLVPGQAPPPSE